MGRKARFFSGGLPHWWDVTGFVVRRSLGALLVLLAATFATYLLVVNSGDPYADLRAIPNPDTLAAQRAARAEALDLGTPPVRRYLGWLAGVVCLGPQGCTLGTDRLGRDVGVLLGQAFTSTLHLVLGAAVLALVLGVGVGVVTALRQDSLFDRGVGAAAVACFSMPPFLLAVLLKQYGALDINQWLTDPALGAGTIAVAAVLAGTFWTLLLPGPPLQRLLVFGVAAAVTTLALGYLSTVRWFADPALGPGVVAVLGAAVTLLLLGLAGAPLRRSVPAAVLVGAGGGTALVVTLPWLAEATSWTRPLGLTAACAAGGAAVGVLFSTGTRRQRSVIALSSAAGGLTVGLAITLEHIMRAVPAYLAASGGVLIPTFGATSGTGTDTFWASVLDRQVHLLLPSLALVLFSFATYLRYTRAGMVAQLRADHITAARSYGLPERSVVLGHALRNALVPVTTVVALDVAALVGGAVVIEQVFGWRGMGALFDDGLTYVDPNPVMAFILVTGVTLVVCTTLADLGHGLLDPRVVR